MLIFCFSITYWWITMEGSSGSARPESNSSRRLNSSGVFGGGVERIGISGDTSLNFGIDRVLLAYSDNIRHQFGVSRVYEDEQTYLRNEEWGDISLRQWLDKPDPSVDVFECLHIFRQIVEIVNVAHSQGIVVHNVRPSCFVMSSFNRVSFIESESCSDSGSDSIEDGLNSQTMEAKDLFDNHHHDINQWKNDLSEASCKRLSYEYPTCGSLDGNDKNKNVEQREDTRKQPFPMKQILLMENSWYLSPEEVAGDSSTCASDIYRLGVLLFELFCPCSSREEKSRTMSSLRHRVLPPQLLLKFPKEASFCLWLLHPEPSSRPKMGELLESEFLNEPRDSLVDREAAIELKERIEEQELLLDFLSLLQRRKQEAADKLQDTVSFLCSDIEEVSKQQGDATKQKGSYPDNGKEVLSTSNPSNIGEYDEPSSRRSRKRCRLGVQGYTNEECDDNLDDCLKSDTLTENQESVIFKSGRLMNNFKKLESAYYLTRCRTVRPSGKMLARHTTPVSSDGRGGSMVVNERSSVSNIASKKTTNAAAGGQGGGWINPFLEGLCKYLSFGKLKVKADLKQGDLLNSSNLVCAISFDRDGEFFATAGVNKKIKVFECDTIVNAIRDIHYPVVEMGGGRSKLSSICWNSYIKSQIASSNFEGVVQVWDVTRSQVVREMREHEKRVWSIDYSSADPTMLASGSDDGSVKLWSINQAKFYFCTLVDVSFQKN